VGVGLPPSLAWKGRRKEEPKVQSGVGELRLAMLGGPVQTHGVVSE
jgi:hypothetical protein